MRVQLMGSGMILNEVIKAAAVLKEQYQVHADIWAVTSHKALHRDAQETDRWNLRHPDQTPRLAHVTHCLQGAPGPVIAVSDYVKTLSDMMSRWIPQPLVSLGTDGFGRSDGREALRDFFEVDANHIVYTTLATLAREGKIGIDTVMKARVALGIDADKPNPLDV